AEDPTAEELFEVERWLRLGHDRARLRRGEGTRGSRRERCGPRGRRFLHSQHALERLHSILEEAQALLDRGFHALLLGRLVIAFSLYSYIATLLCVSRLVRLASRGRLLLLDTGARAVRRHRRAGDRAQLRLSRLVRGRARRVPARVRRRLSVA